MAKNRSLFEAQKKLNRRFPVLEHRLQRLLGIRQPVHVLEVAFGEGRALLELAARFRGKPVHYYGVEKKSRPGMGRRDDLRAVLRKYNILPEAEIDAFPLPEIYFYDATRLHFPDESLDLIYSVVAIRFFERKAEFLEEVSRVLKPRGTAFLHIGESGWDYPYSRACDDWLLTPVRNRFILKYQDELIPLPAYLRLFQGRTFTFRFINRPRCVLKIQKHRSGTLDLQLSFDADRSDWLRMFPYARITGESQGGFRSVYDVSALNYAALFDRGILDKQALRTDIKMPPFLTNSEAA